MCIRTAWCYSRIARLPQDFDKFVLICESWEKHVSHSRIVDVSFLLEIVVSPKISTSSINFTKPTSLLISGCCLSHLSEELTRISRHAKGKQASGLPNWAQTTTRFGPIRGINGCLMNASLIQLIAIHNHKKEFISRQKQPFGLNTNGLS
jgi:hypothetical protein